ncbi:hypothetical protein [Bacteroides cellulosilyticus]|jgi:hypothetical protein|uniref:hypothetical protein n=1 Tax=Bacteroides cellulosilyticus TaxID=246787 RepID=UPI00189D8B08|nr:hypothetical protein [Bacteroides cellulosilyticus]DAU03778.1 MAG TPA: major capsid protein [Caudoviricetes sp.]
MNIKERIQTVLQKLKLLDKAKANQLTDEEWKQIVDSYQKEYQSTLQDDLAADMAAHAATNTPITQEQMDQVQGILDSIVNPSQNATQDGEEKPVVQTTQTPATGTDIVQLAQAVQGLVNTMQNSATEDRPIQTVTATTASFTGPADRTKFLFGIENSMFSMTDRWNRIAANPAAAASFGAWDEDTEGASFRKQAVAFSRSLQKRYAYLHANGMLDAKKLAAGEFGTNYEGVNTAGVGNQFVVLRQDALIARVLTKRDLTQYFPVRYGIQDHDLVFNAFFSEVSQAYQQGEIWKGDMKLENEMGHVDDAMIKLKFGPMKELERMYIGYLNKEGSDPIKWNMIEFCILNSLETAQVEQNKRRMRGIYVKPETGVAGSYLNASTGVIYTLLRYIHEFKILPHDDEAYRGYTDADMLDAVQDFVADIITSCTEDMDIDNHVLYLNKTHQPWWIKNVRAKYGKDIDFTGPDSYKYVVPDTNVHIIWLPYLGQLPLMFMDVPGNIQFLEYVPGEMLSIKVKEDMELVKAWSTWKEGCSASFTGRRFDSLDKLKANNYEWQQIFMNKPAVDMEADATTVDASKGFWQITVANTAAKAITDITNAKAGVAYIIECGSTENATTIAKAGKFADITEAYTPTKVGDYIMLILNSKGNFLELERQVAGVRKVNAALQPNIPGVR